LYRRLGGPQGESGRVRKISNPDSPARNESLYRLSYRSPYCMYVCTYVCVCVCVCIYIYAYVCMYVYIYIYIQRFLYPSCKKKWRRFCLSPDTAALSHKKPVPAGHPLTAVLVRDTIKKTFCVCFVKLLQYSSGRSQYSLPLSLSINMESDLLYTSQVYSS